MGPIFAIVAIDATGFGVIFPLLPFYSEHFGATPLLVGVLLASYSLCQFIAAPWIGRLSDRVGRKPILIASQIGTLAGFILLASAHSLALVFLARIIDGLTAGNLSVAFACAVDGSTPATRKQAVGVVSAAIGIGFMVGPALAGLFAPFSIAAPVWVAAGLSAGSIVATTLLLPNQTKLAAASVIRQPARAMLTNATVPVLGLLLLFYMAFSMFMSQLALVLAARFQWQGKPLDAHDVGLVFTALGATNIFAQLVLMKRVAPLLSDRMLAMLGFGVLALGYGMIGSTHSTAVLGLAVVVSSLGASFVRPTLVSALSTRSPPGQQGAMQGVNTSLMAGAGVTGPLFAGLLIGRQFYGGWTAAIAGLAAAGALAALVALGRQVEPAASAAGGRGPRHLPGRVSSANFRE